MEQNLVEKWAEVSVILQKYKSLRVGMTHRTWLVWVCATRDYFNHHNRALLVGTQSKIIWKYLKLDTYMLLYRFSQNRSQTRWLERGTVQTLPQFAEKKSAHLRSSSTKRFINPDRILLLKGPQYAVNAEATAESPITNCPRSLLEMTSCAHRDRSLFSPEISELALEVMSAENQSQAEYGTSWRGFHIEGWISHDHEEDFTQKLECGRSYHKRGCLLLLSRRV